jgi:hypothetical protein
MVAILSAKARPTPFGLTPTPVPSGGPAPYRGFQQAVAQDLPKTFLYLKIGRCHGVAIKVELARTQIFRLAYVVRNVAFYRSLAPFQKSFAQNYWIYVFNNFLDMAVLEWCKVFGSRGEETHWSTLVEDPDAFRTAMLAEFHLTRDEWDKYWERMKNYRDAHIAHHTRDPRVTKYPHLDIALRACFFYYKHLLRELRNVKDDPLYFYPPDLEAYYERLLVHAREVSEVAYAASRGIEDKVK